MLTVKSISYRKIVLLILLLLILVAWFFGVGDTLSLQEIRQYQFTIENYVQQNYLAALLIYIVAYILVVAISLPGAATMTLIGGFLFGQYIGTIATVISATIGAMLIFICIRYFSSGMLHKNSANLVNKMQQGFNRDAFNYLLFLRLVPLFPFFAINIVAALLQVRTVVFFWGTLLGIIPGTFIYVTLGSALQDLSYQPEVSWKIVLGLTGLALVVLSPVIYKK